MKVFIPFTDRVCVIVEQDTAEKKDAHGLLVPDVAREKPTIARVVAVGRGIVTASGAIVPLQCGVGDRIVFSKHGGKKQEIEGVEYLILHESEILGLIRCLHTGKDINQFGDTYCVDCGIVFEP